LASTACLQTKLAVACGIVVSHSGAKGSFSTMVPL
jgi:hypothetical protein